MNDGVAEDSAGNSSALQDIEDSIAYELYFTAADAIRFGWLTSDHDDAEKREAVRNIADSLGTSSYASICASIDINCKGSVPRGMNLLTICVIVLRNGFIVTGESLCVLPELMDPIIERHVARTKARNKVRGLRAFALKEWSYRLFQNKVD